VDNQVAIAQVGGIAPLIALVRDGTEEQKVQAAGALWQLTFDPSPAADPRRRVSVLSREVLHDCHDNQ
jgi:hypothetical protein